MERAKVYVLPAIAAFILLAYYVWQATSGPATEPGAESGSSPAAESGPGDAKTKK